MCRQGDGFARDDGAEHRGYRAELLRAEDNDLITRDDGARVVAVEGQPVSRVGLRWIWDGAPSV